MSTSHSQLISGGHRFVGRVSLRVFSEDAGDFIIFIVTFTIKAKFSGNVSFRTQSKDIVGIF